MANLDRRSGKYMSRGAKTDRAYKLLLATGGFGIVGLVSLFAFSVLLGLVLLVVAAVCGFQLTKTLGR